MIYNNNRVYSKSPFYELTLTFLFDERNIRTYFCIHHIYWDYTNYINAKRYLSEIYGIDYTFIVDIYKCWYFHGFFALTALL